MRAFTLFLVLCATASAGDCNNPVVANPEAWGAVSSQFPKKLTLAPAPIDYPTGAQQCAYFANDKQCCTNDTLSAIKESFDVANAVIDAARDEINNNKWVNSTLKVIENAILLVCNNITFCPHDFAAQMTKYLNDISAKSTAIQNAQLDCVGTQLAYIEGMTCFACDAEWAKYLNNASKTVALADNVCNGIVKGCQPVHNSINALLMELSQFISTVLTWGTLIKFNITLDNVPDLCGGTFKNPGDCTRFFCHDMLNGFGVPAYGWNPFSEMTTLITHTPAAAKEWLSSNMVNLHRRLFSEVAKARSVTVANTKGINEYTSTGYDAVTVGCMDMRTQAGCEERSTGLPAYATTLIVLSVVGALAVGVICWQRRKKSSGDSYDPIRG